MSQNGRSKYSVGQGSRGMGAPALSGLSEPGLSGEWMSLLKRYKPPVGAPLIFSLKAAAMGVGRVGIAGSLPLMSLSLNRELPGVFGDTSDPSSIFDTDKLRLLIFLRLDEEKFFLSPILECVRPGDPDRGNCPLVSLS